MRELDYWFDDIEEEWNKSSKALPKIAKEILGENRGKMFDIKQALCFSEEIRQKTKQKKEEKTRYEPAGENLDLGD